MIFKRPAQSAQKFRRKFPEKWSPGPNFRQEAYWQLNGPGWWRTWPDNFTTAPNQKPFGMPLECHGMGTYGNYPLGIRSLERFLDVMMCLKMGDDMG